MTTSALFSTFLHDLMSARKMTFDELIYELKDTEPATVQGWLAGHDVPALESLPGVANALRADLAEVAVGWLIDRLPQVHDPLHEAVLKPRGSIFPCSEDLSLRAPQRLPPLVGETMDVGDPHDAVRSPREIAITPERRARKRPLVRVR